MLREHDARLQGPVEELHRVETLLEMMRAVWVLVRWVAVLVLEERLRTLAEARQTWPYAASADGGCAVAGFVPAN
jgi:hypothetical protein